jgi:hypothetical protein
LGIYSPVHDVSVSVAHGLILLASSVGALGQVVCGARKRRNEDEFERGVLEEQIRVGRANGGFEEVG